MKTKIDNITCLGSHRIACGDSLDKELVKELIKNEKIRLILTDPPYGVNYVQNKAGFMNIKKKVEIVNDSIASSSGYMAFSSGWLDAVKPYLAPKNACYIFNSDKMIFSLRDAMEASGYNLSQLLIWIKNNQVIGRKDYCLKHELIAYGWHGSHRFYKSKDKSVIFYPKPQSSPLHPTSKPVGLLRRLILNSTRIGDIVYDPFGGSGSTLIACEQTKRRCFTIEIDGKYCKIIINRYKKLRKVI